MNAILVSNSKSKEEVRKDVLLRIKTLSLEDKDRGRTQLTKHLKSFLSQQKGKWGAFCALSEEVSPQEAITQSSHLQWAYPKINKNNLEFYLNPKAWVNGDFNVSEPDPSQSEPISIHDLQGYLIPGLAFDLQGNRLGRGMGFFDRALVGYKGIKVGLAWHEQLVSGSLPNEAFDIPMDLIITNKGIIFNKLNNTQEGRTQR